MTQSSTHWQTHDQPARTLYRMLLIFFAFATPYVGGHILAMGVKNDYFAFWSFATFVKLHSPGLIYDYDLLRSFQHLPNGFFPYFYQPQMLLVVWPLAQLPYALGYALWMLTGTVACATVTGFVARNPAAVFAVLVGPSTLLVWICGQSSMIAAALMFGGFGLLPRRPVFAGVLFGLMIYKPQLGVLVPVALLASRQWRTIASACVTAVLFLLASAAVFGVSVWVSWWQHLPSIGATIASKTVEFRFLMATVTSNLLSFGANPLQAHAVQAVCSLAIAILVWRCFRGGVCMLGAALVGAGTFLATPFAFGYDLAVFNLAVIVTASERWRRHGSFSLPEVAILVLGFLLPWCAISPTIFRFSSVLVFAVLCVILRRIQAVRNEGAVVNGGANVLVATA
ncbi:glycosyltransferase family 87 protein [Lichenicoccus sp.]|uniref:glycosyltransferase family 87 protein n=1 Tax=Lichenicoccus sp. TaxID=2781899 RepID=UPI003D1231A8